ncbi:MAG TPA: glycosyltransferase family 4 protein [Candidatus Lokiarchaeia archaeon]|nr:glycosyltransferase family 4 protein [Candidatus Lokiarchaeia archaeon]
MTIIHVSPRYFPAISGAEFYFQRISEILQKKRDIEVHCTNALDFSAFSNQDGKKIKRSMNNPESINGVRVFRHDIDYDKEIIEEERVLLGQALFIEDTKTLNDVLLEGPASRSLRLALEQAGTELVHATCFPYENIYSALRVANLKHIPCVLTPFLHGENPRYHRESITVLDQFTKILACSKAEQDFLVQHGVARDKIKLITMGVDIDRFHAATTERFVNVTSVNPDKHKIILFSGYKNYEKGAITLLKAVPLVVSKIPESIFVMIGPPTKQYNLEMTKLGNFKKHVININPSNLAGYFDKIKLGAFKACHVYAMPSRSEAYGIAYLEAFACKKPIIAAAIPAMFELFMEGRECMHVNFDMVNELGEMIIYLLENERAREELGQNGYDKISREKLTWQDVARNILGIYDDLLSGAGR